MAGQGSARVTLREIDLSQVRDPEQLPQGVPAAVVGPAKRGPAFVPKTFATIQQFEETFGSLRQVDRESNANRFGPLALNEWMRNAQAGTFLRVLGVGSGTGQKDSSGRVAGAGFVVGDKVSHDASNDLRNNPFATTSEAGGAALAGRTHFLGCFMADTVASDGSKSTFLEDAGVQQFLPAELEDAIDVNGNPAQDDSFDIFLPKEVIPGGTDDITLTVKIRTALSGTVDKNVIEIKDNGSTTTIATSIKEALNHVGTTADESEYKFSDISGINPSQVFDVVDGNAVTKKTIKLQTSTREGNLVTLTSSQNTRLLNAASKTLVAEKVSSPVVRGILMSPQGVVPSLDLTDTQAHTGTDAPIVETTHLRKSVANGGSLRTFGGNEAINLIGHELGKVDVENDQTFTLLLNGFSNTDEPAQITCSFNPESVNYFAKVLNTDPEKIEERGHYLQSHWDIDPAVAKASILNLKKGNTAAATNENLGFCLRSTGTRNVEAANTPNFESFETRFRTARSPWIKSQKFGGVSSKLFRLYSLDDGSVGNDRFRILISNIRAGATSEDFGFFDLTLEDFYSDPVSGEALVVWKNLTLDPDSRNFIGRVIGDKHMYYDFDRDLSRQRLVEEGMFEVRNKYVRVELSDSVKLGDIPKTTLPCGFSDYTTLNLRAKTGLFDESVGAIMATTVFDKISVSPLPLVKTITRISGSSTEASDSLAWGVKFAKKQSAADGNELGEIRFNPSIKSWTTYVPDLGSDDGRKFALISTEEFSLEKIAYTTASSIDWSTSQYMRDHRLAPVGKSFVDLSEAAKVGRNVRYLKFRCLMQGGFDGVNIFNKDKAAMNSAAAFREANEETTGVFTGPTVETFKRAIDVLSDKSATEFQLLAIPDMREPLVTDYAITACESRFDAMLVMDIQEVEEGNEVILDSVTKPHVGNIITKFDARNLDTSFAAAYFPDVLTRRPSNGSPLQVPPSVCMLGVMSQNDTLADPWFAPAGLTRGRLNAVNSKVQMNRDVLNDLYDVDINPIYEPAGRAGEVYAFGQKTLLQNQSALDRVNVRRLLINIRRRVKSIANTLLFEPNRASTLARFSSLVEPIMADVQARQGVERYKVQIDTSTTTQNDVENNTIRGKIYLQPTKSVEFISLDFVVTNSID